MSNIVKIESLAIQDIKMVETVCNTDFRGTNTKIFSHADMKKNGLLFSPLEILMLHSNKNVIRGLHYQAYYEQSRVIGYSSGKLYVVAVNIMQNSPDFGRYCSYILQNQNQCIFIPEGYAVGTGAIEETDFYCMIANNPYDAKFSKGVLWDDAEIGINWPIDKNDVVISETDLNWPTLKALNTI